MTGWPLQINRCIAFTKKQTNTFLTVFAHMYVSAYSLSLEQFLALKARTSGSFLIMVIFTSQCHAYAFHDDNVATLSGVLAPLSESVVLWLQALHHMWGFFT